MSEFTLKKTFYKKKKIVLAGLDLSLRHTGLVVINTLGEVLYRESLVYKEVKKDHRMYFKVNGESNQFISITKADGTLDNLKRNKLIKDRLAKVLKALSVTHVAVEDYAMGAKGRVFSIGELGGIVKNMLYEKKFTFETIPPTSLKSFITGKGNAKKEVVMEAIMKKYFIGFDDDNEADAFALARTYLEFGEELPLFCKKGGPKKYLELIKDKES